MRPLKKPMSYHEQIEHLKNDHHLMVEDEASAESILREVNYYRLSAYGIGLTIPDNRDTYVEGITIEHLYNLYEFDVQLRSIITPAIEHIEIKLRTQISYILAMEYGAEGYRDSKNFIEKYKKNGESVYQKTMELLDREIIRQKNLPFVKHHQEEYEGHFPIWVATELFSFGMLSSLFSVMVPNDREKIAKEYGLKDSRPLTSWILCLVEIRNKCAHYTRLYNMPLAQAPTLFKENKKYASNKIFPALLVIKRMLGADSKVWIELFIQLQGLIAKTPEAQLPFMGFPENWSEVLTAGEKIRQPNL